MKMGTITSVNENVRSELENCQRIYALWLLMIGSGVFGRVLARAEPEECATYVTFQIGLAHEKQIECVERVQGYHRGSIGKGIAKILLDKHKELAQKCAIVIPDYALDEEELSEHWAYYLERSAYKVVRAI